ncbi:hypothetical protein [Flavobacterium kingsejongi]|uniref:Uncharacterized protein n=1 Tax=Flavobacterium kingsejongi TaxID=1678728 RepID=A0A2S1LPZ9_9FLAO|nr:hypothetical protein [Flavobacterium kingsejongi]AWG25778.1 hypothetical protein FK004_11370 [Flavobacterium kingsejongi]
MKNKLLPLLFVLGGYAAYSQVGIGTSMPNGSSQLEVVADDKGILIPRIRLTSTTDNLTIQHGNVNSLLVFNTSTIADVKPGYYYWYVNKWNRIIVSGEVNPAVGTVFFNPVTNQFTYIDTAGNTQVVNMEQIVRANQTVTTLVNNNNGTYTYTNEAGVTALINVPADVAANFQTIINNPGVQQILNSYVMHIEGNVAYNATTNTFTYTDAAGNTQTVNMEQIVRANQTVTTLVNNNNGTYTYTNEAGVTASINVPADVATNFQTIINNPGVQQILNSYVMHIEGNVAYNATTNTFTYTDAAGNTQTVNMEQIVRANQTVTTLVNNNDGTYTYTNEAGVTSVVNPQTLSIASNILTLSNGGTVDLTPFLDNTDDQQISSFVLDPVTKKLSVTLENGGTQEVDFTAVLNNVVAQATQHFANGEATTISGAGTESNPYKVGVNAANGTTMGGVKEVITNPTVNIVDGALVVNTANLSIPAASVVGNNVTAASDRVVLGGTPVGATLKPFSVDVDETKLVLSNLSGQVNPSQIFSGASGQMLVSNAFGGSQWISPSSISTAISNTLESTANTITSTVNGQAATAPIVNSLGSTLSGANIITTVNGVAGAGLDLTPAIQAAQKTTSVANGSNTTVNSTVTGNNTEYTVAVNAANGTALGGVKEAATNPTVNIVDGALTVNTANLNVPAASVTGTDVTAGSNRVALGGTPVGAALKSFSVDVNEANLSLSNIGGSLATSQINATTATPGQTLVVNPAGSVVYGNLPAATVTGTDVTAGSNRVALGGTPVGASLKPFTVDVNEANLSLSNIGGSLATSQINATTATPGQTLVVNPAGSVVYGNLPAATVTGTDVTAGSNRVALGGTPVGASLKPFTVDVNEANLSLSNIGGSLATSQITPGTAGQVLVTNAGTTTWMDQSTLAPATTNTLGSTVNTITSTVNGQAATAPIVNSLGNTLSGANIITTVNGVAGSGLDLTPAIQAAQKTTSVVDGTNTTVSSTVTGNNTAYKVDVTAANGTALGGVKEAATNPTVNIVDGALTVNTANLNVPAASVTGTDVTAGSNRVALGGTPVGAALKAFSVDVNEANLSLSNIGGSLATSQINATTATPGQTLVVNPAGSVVYGNLPAATVTGTDVTAGSNRVALGGTPVGASLKPFTVDVNEANLSLSNIGGSLTPTQIAPGAAGQVLVTNGGVTTWMNQSAIVPNTTNALSSAGNIMTATVNGIPATAPIVNSLGNTLSGANIITTVNGMAGAALDLTPAIQAAQKTTSVVDGTNTTVSSTVTGNNTAYKVDVTPANGTALGGVKEAATNPTVNIVDGTLTVNTANLNVPAASVTGTDVTAGSNRVALGGTPVGAALKSFSVDVNEANLSLSNIGGSLATSQINATTATPGQTLVVNPAGNVVYGNLPAATVIGNNVTAGSDRVTLGGTPVGATLKPFSVDVDETRLVLSNQSGKVTNNQITPGTSGQVLVTTAAGSTQWANPSTIVAPTVNTLTTSGNTSTSTVNGEIATASIVNSLGNTITGANLVTTVNGVAGAPLDLTAAIQGNQKTTSVANGTNTTVSSTVTGNNTEYKVAVNPANGIVLGSVKEAGTNPTVNIVDGALTVNTANLNVPAASVTGNDVTAASNRITLGGNPIGAALKAFSVDVNQANLSLSSIGGSLTPAQIAPGTTGQVLITNAGTTQWVNQTSLVPTTTNTLGSTVNTITSTVNGQAATASIVNSLGNTLSGTTIVTTVNGVAGSGLDLTPAIHAAQKTTSVANGTNTTVSSTVTGNNTEYKVTVSPANGTALGSVKEAATNPTVNIVDGALTVNTANLTIPAASVTGNNVTPGSDRVILGGTPTGAALKAFSVDVDETKLVLSNLSGKVTNNQITPGTSGQVLVTTAAGSTQWVNQSTIAPATTVANTVTGTNLSTTVNGVTGTAVNLTPAIQAGQKTTSVANGTNTTVSSTVTGNNTEYKVAVNPANGIVLGSVKEAATNPTVNIVDGALTVNTANLNVPAASVTGNDVTAASNRITLGGTPIGAALKAFSVDVNQANLNLSSIGGSLTPAQIAPGTTGQVLITNAGTTQWVNQSSLVPATINALASSGNVMTATVNGVAATAPIVNTLGNTLSGTTIITTVNGVAGSGLDLTPAVQAAQKTTSVVDGTTTTVSSTVTGNNTAYKVEVAAANGTALGGVKEATTNPTVNVVNGTLVVNPANLTIPAASVTGNNVTAGSDRVTLGGTPTGAALKAFSVDVDETKLVLSNLSGKVTNNQITPGTSGQVLVTTAAGSTQWVNQSTIAPATTVANTVTGTNLSTTVNGVTGAAVNLTPAIQAGQKITTVSNGSNTVATGTVTGNTTDYKVTVNNATATVAGVVKAGAGLTVDGTGTLAVDAATITSGKALTSTDLVVSANGSTALLKDVSLAIAENAITSAKIADGEVKTADIADRNVTAAKLTAGTGTANRIATADATGNVTYTDLSTLVTGDETKLVNGTNTTVTGTGTATNQYAVNVATGGAALGVVKQAATTPVVTINAAGELAVNANNGLSVATGNVQLGGALTKATTVTATATNTLAVAGLQTGTTADKIVVADATSGVLRQMNSAMPRFFYMPSIVIPTAADQITDGTTFGTINLYNRYSTQFATPTVSNPGKTTTLPVLAASALDYYITWFDATVFDNVTVSNTGVLTYTVKANADVTVGSFMNIVFAVK